MGSLWLQNVATQETTRFFISRNSSKPNDNEHRLAPGSYKVTKTELLYPNRSFFSGNFIKLEGSDAVFGETIPVRRLSPFTVQRPNFMTVTVEDTGRYSLVTLNAPIE